MLKLFSIHILLRLFFCTYHKMHSIMTGKMWASFSFPKNTGITTMYTLFLMFILVACQHLQCCNILAFVHSCFTEDYRRACLATAVQLLKKLCRGVKPDSYTQNFPDVPVACMNVVALVSDFIHSNTQQVCRVNCRRQDVSISGGNRSC